MAGSKWARNSLHENKCQQVALLRHSCSPNLLRMAWKGTHSSVCLSPQRCWHKKLYHKVFTHSLLGKIIAAKGPLLLL